MLERYHLTPEQVDSLDPDFMEELNARLLAEGDVEGIRANRAKAEGQGK